MSNLIGIVGSLLSLHSLFLLVKILLALPLLYSASYIIYNLYFHPLRKFPGPRLAAATQLYTSYYIIMGRPVKYMSDLHAKYGEVVRTKPNELSFISETAWRDIFAHRQGKPQMKKGHAEVFEVDKVANIHNADDENHGRIRRSIAHAFSDKALREQEPLMHRYYDLLIKYVRDHVKTGEAFNIIQLLDWAAFDIIGDLAFGEPFGSLEAKKTHPWVEKFFASIQTGAVMYEVLEFMGPLQKWFLDTFIIPLAMSGTNEVMIDYTIDKIEKRLDRGPGDRPDLMSFVLKNNEEGKGMSKKEIVSTFNIIVVAGSETIGSSTSGILWSLLRYPREMAKLKDEIYETFANEKEINIGKTWQMPYLNACIAEGIRVFAPTAVMIPEVVEPGGTEISGYHVPGGTIVGIPTPTAFSSPQNFSEPRTFIPERWIDTSNPRFAADKRGVFKPFSTGPRQCVGQNLANSEMRLILTRLLYNFDLELADPSFQWDDQGARIIRIKPPLYVRAKESPRARRG